MEIAISFFELTRPNLFNQRLGLFKKNLIIIFHIFVKIKNYGKEFYL